MIPEWLKKAQQKRDEKTILSCLKRGKEEEQYFENELITWGEQKHNTDLPFILDTLIIAQEQGLLKHKEAPNIISNLKQEIEHRYKQALI